MDVETQGETGSSKVVVSTTIPWQSQDVAANFGPNNVAASQTFGFAPLPPYDTQTVAQAQDEIAMDIGSAPGQSSLEDNPDRKRAKIYDSLLRLAKANSSTTEHAVQGIIDMPIHSNGWYDNWFTRSCVCDYSGHHIIPEYITSGSLYRGRVL